MVYPKQRLQALLIPFALAALLLIVAACTAPPPAAAPETAAPLASAEVANGPTAAPEPADVQASQPVGTPRPALDLPVGVDKDGNFYRGNPDASVTILEYSDFQCPFCSRHVKETEPQIDSTFIATGEVLHVYRHFPLDFHANAIPASKAAYCAGQQDPKLFWAMHDWLFAQQSAWSEATDAAVQFRAQALAAGADGTKFDACVGDAATEARIRLDMQDGQTAGVSGTPAFFINGWFVEGAYPFAEFQDKIGRAKQGEVPPPTPTPMPAGQQIFDADPNRPGFTYDGSPTLGDADARLVLMAFEDFKCGYCARHAADVEPALKEKYVATGQMRLVFKFFPIYAPESAAASLCAAEQGKFWEYHDTLFANQQAWQDGEAAKFQEFAKTLNLDTAKFDKCVKDQTYKAQVAADYDLGRQAGINGTPTFFLIDQETGTGSRIPGALPLADFDKAIQALLNPATPAPDVTPTPGS